LMNSAATRVSRSRKRRKKLRRLYHVSEEG
jgi:hypothetical protein